MIAAHLTACGNSANNKPYTGGTLNESSGASGGDYGYYSSVYSSNSSSASSSSESAAFTALLPTAKTTAFGPVFQADGQVWVLTAGAGTAFSAVKQDRTGQNLYTFDTDVAGSSACVTANCVTQWPPLLADNMPAVSAPFSIVLRADGHKQLALRDKPLYFFAGDTHAGDTLGEGKNGVWHLATQAPIALNTPSLNSNDGDYYVANAKVWAGGLTAAENRQGFSVYTFDKDTAAVSNCINACATQWPPLLAAEGETAQPPYSLVTRADTPLKQWALHNQPLYFFKNDTVAGSTAGKSITHWRLARPINLQQTASTAGTIYAALGQVDIAHINTTTQLEEIIRVNKNGFSLYTFDKDTDGQSHCTPVNDCITKWPALMAQPGAQAVAPFSLVSRASGWQWALNGRPLYLFAGDTQNTDVKGDGVGGVWHLARLAPVAIKHSATEGPYFTAHGDLINADNSVDSLHENFTLYTRTADAANASSCTGACITNWPPLYAPANAQPFGDFTLIARPATAGAPTLYQWAYKTRALYFYKGDLQQGDTLGKSEAWPLAKVQ